jgi:hypothetical protein
MLDSGARDYFPLDQSPSLAVVGTPVERWIYQSSIAAAMSKALQLNFCV